MVCVIYVCSKYTWIIHLKGKKGTTITNAFQEILDESNRELKNIWTNQGREFYSRSMKSGNLLLLKYLLEL